MNYVSLVAAACSLEHNAGSDRSFCAELGCWHAVLIQVLAAAPLLLLLVLRFHAVQCCCIDPPDLRQHHHCLHVKQMFVPSFS